VEKQKPGKWSYGSLAYTCRPDSDVDVGACDTVRCVRLPSDPSGVDRGAGAHVPQAITQITSKGLKHFIRSTRRPVDKEADLHLAGLRCLGLLVMTSHEALALAV